MPCTRIKKKQLSWQKFRRWGGARGPPRVKKLKHSTETTDPPTSPRGEVMSEPPAFVGGAVRETPAVPCTRIRKKPGRKKKVSVFLIRGRGYMFLYVVGMFFICCYMFS